LDSLLLFAIDLIHRNNRLAYYLQYDPMENEFQIFSQKNGTPPLRRHFFYRQNADGTCIFLLIQKIL